ncbi:MULTISPECIES: hypothetical protein [unclassified Mesorhizobium]|uniref:hypothetical protein n=1 Tax=unclassified Mesorhizobium TaxID=325217 RepID=UPI000F762A80|nr:MULTISPECIES: hypothetical protein [unclassified Mesorhizobium]AZO12769.1 hypothetical protein EJ074_29300 [Mesorhizobium sp. M3A.F.Ca.ET.080.04.2.1]RWB70222.1 MAG: hypothetical protein EOQ49_17915 [Mesorhizobium sp.]
MFWRYRAPALASRSRGMQGVIHVWTAPVEQEDSDNGNTEAVRFIHVFGLFLCGLRPLAMMVSVDRALIKLPRCDAR